MTVQQAAPPVISKKSFTVVCRHYWVIEPAGGPLSHGVCKTCKETRVFKNFLDGVPFNDDLPWTESNARTPVKTPADGHLEPDEM